MGPGFVSSLQCNPGPYLGRLPLRFLLCCDSAIVINRCEDRMSYVSACWELTGVPGPERVLCWLLIIHLP